MNGLSKNGSPKSSIVGSNKTKMGNTQSSPNFNINKKPLFPARMSKTSLPPLANELKANVHHAPKEETKPAPAISGAANSFNVVLENDRLRTENMMLKTKMKSLTDKLNITKNDDNRALHL